jgi:hypothetical protein
LCGLSVISSTALRLQACHSFDRCAFLSSSIS